MGGKVNYTLVGLFVVVLGGALVSFVVWLAARTPDTDYQTYVAYMSESVSGLNPNAAVKYRGVDVGQVREIDLDRDNPERVELLLDIEKGTPVKDDTVATLSTQGITGLAFVELTGGSREAPLLEARPGEPYPEIETGPSLLVRLDTAVTTALTELGEVANSVRSVTDGLQQVLGPENQQALARTLTHVDTLTGTLAARADELDRSIRHATTILESSAEASAELPEAVRRVNASLAAVEQAVNSIDAAARTVDGAVAGTREDLMNLAGDALGPMRPLLVELRQAAETLGRLSREVERDPNLLLFGRSVEPGPGE